tara:strand:+ start:425 stop:925 length:501 start_codon:yes stop_codon:yes gene_type:complete
MEIGKTNLYRHFDDDGVLLYVGISLNAIKRTSQHIKCSPWSRDIKRIEIDEFETRKAAMIAETDAIQAEKPLHNKQKTKPPKKKMVVTYIEESKTKLTHKVTTLQPFYDLSDLSDFGLNRLRAEKLIADGLLGSIKLDAHRRKIGYRVVVSGWQLLEYIEDLHNAS